MIDDLIKDNEKLIYKIASRFNNIDKEDLYQVGVIGLINAYKNYDCSSNTKFSTYAYDYIFGEMYKFCSQDRCIKLSKDYLKLYKRIEQTRYLLAQKLGYMPSNTDISLFLEIDKELIDKVIIASKQILSLDYQEDDKEDYYEVIASKDLNTSDKLDIDDSFKVLNESEKQIIDYRYYKDYTQSETAKILGMTQVMVSRYEKKGINKMRSYLMS